MRNGTKAFAATVLGVAFGLGLAGCGNPEAVKFNQEVSSVANKAFELNKEFAETIKSTKEEDKVKAAYAKVVKGLEEVASEAEKLKTPDDADSKTYVEAFRSMLKKQQKIYSDDVKPAVDLILAKDSKAAAKVLVKAYELRDAEEQALFAAQTAFAKAKGLRVK